MEKDFNQEGRVKLLKMDKYNVVNLLNADELKLYYEDSCGYPIYSAGTHMRGAYVGKLLGMQIAHFLFDKFKSLPAIKCNIVFTGSSGSFLMGAALESIKNTLCKLSGESESNFRAMEKFMLRLIYIPKNGEKRHDYVSIHDFFQEELIIFVDDLIDSGDTLLRVIEFIANLYRKSELRPITQVFCENIFKGSEECFRKWYDPETRDEYSKSLDYQNSDIEVYTLN